MMLGKNELDNRINDCGYCVYSLGNYWGYYVWKRVLEGIRTMQIDEEELEAQAKELWLATLEKVRLDKDDAGIELAKQIVKLDQEEKWRRRNW